MKGRNAGAYDLYQQIQAGAPMPADAIVQEYCGLIYQVHEQVRLSRADVMPLVGLLAAGGGKRGH